MAEANISVAVSVESVIADALLEFAKHIYAEYGVQIDHAAFDWVDVSTAVLNEVSLAEVYVQLAKRPGVSPGRLT